MVRAFTTHNTEEGGRMQVLEIHTPGVSTYVKYRTINPVEVQEFAERHQHLGEQEYIRAVMDLVVYNLRTDVIESLREMDKADAFRATRAIYHGCVMINPGLDLETWLNLSTSSTTPVAKALQPKSTQSGTSSRTDRAKDYETESEEAGSERQFIISRSKFRGLADHLSRVVVGQGEAVDKITKALKRSAVGMSDTNRPLGVFLFAGASGVGKTLLAKELHKYLFGSDYDIVRIDCGEYQHKHENQKLLGSPAGFVGYDEGSKFADEMMEQPQTVVLLDEVEKAHPDLWNTFLRVFDEGILTDSQGNEISFKDSIIIMTTNLGNRESIDHLMTGGTGFTADPSSNLRGETPSRDALVGSATKAIRKHFRPEFLNRIDQTVVFNHLTEQDMEQICHLELDLVAQKLAERGILFDHAPGVVEAMIERGVNVVEGVRGLSKIRREEVEDRISDVLIEQSRWKRGTSFTMVVEDGEIAVSIKKPEDKTITPAEDVVSESES